MASNSGKRFEEDFEQSALNVTEIDLERLKDPTGGRAGVRNICDFIGYQWPSHFYFELKSRMGNTFNFKELSSNQYLGLKAKAEKRGTIPGLVVLFSDHNEAYFVHIKDVYLLKDVDGKKSLHIEDARRLGTRLEGTRKRTRFRYDLVKLMKELTEKYGWNSETNS